MSWLRSHFHGAVYLSLSAIAPAIIHMLPCAMGKPGRALLYKWAGQTPEIPSTSSCGPVAEQRQKVFVFPPHQPKPFSHSNLSEQYFPWFVVTIFPSSQGTKIRWMELRQNSSILSFVFFSLPWHSLLTPLDTCRWVLTLSLEALVQFPRRLWRFSSVPDWWGSWRWGCGFIW